MKIYKTVEEIKKDIKNNVLEINGDVMFECSFSIEASIKVNAGNIIALNINAWDIITTGNIISLDINAFNIIARDITYYAFCVAYDSIKCSSIKGMREKHSLPICLDGKLEIKKEGEFIK